MKPSGDNEFIKFVEEETKLSFKEFQDILQDFINKSENMNDLKNLVFEKFKLNVFFTLLLLQYFQLQKVLKVDKEFTDHYIETLIASLNLKFSEQESENDFTPRGYYRKYTSLRDTFSGQRVYLDHYLPDYNLAINTHQIEDEYLETDPRCLYKLSPYQESLYCNKFGIRLIHLFTPFLWDYSKMNVFENLIAHALKQTQTRYYARDCRVEVRPAISMKPFFLANNIQGYRNARTAFCLIHKKTNEVLMIYTVGYADFSKGFVDAEIARGACKLGCSVVGGASKLWKFIQEYYATRNLDGSPGAVNTIVYYVDCNFYDGNSISFLENTEFIRTQEGFWNFWVESKELKNREPRKHKLIMEKTKQDLLFPVYNAGTQTNIWFRYADDPKRIEAQNQARIYREALIKKYGFKL